MRVGLAIGMLGLATMSAMAQGGGQGSTAASTAPVLVFETEKGTFEIETFPQHAPKTVAHLVGLVQKKFYTGLRVHRVVPGFVVQMGDPLTRDMSKRDLWGTGNSGKPIGVAEFGKGLKHAIGVVSMAHGGDPARTADSQFFIVIGKASHLDGVHQIWGRVSSGMDVVNKLAVPDRIIRATVKGAK
jgi:peptidyl-prolyl cis-trans isomerase B (cyclophilin B)